MKLTIDNMNKKIFFILALFCAVVQGTWAQDSPAFGGGNGSSDEPYIISSEDHWNQFAASVAAGTNYVGQHFRLDEDITVTTMVGTVNGEDPASSNKFSGDFDGNGHTLTVHYGTESDPITQDYCAPFRSIMGSNENVPAYIHNLHVDGTIYTNRKFAAGVVALSLINGKISDCRVSVAINSDFNGDGRHGGLVAYSYSGMFTISNSVFDGSMIGSNTSGCGGFIGSFESVPLMPVMLDSCLFAPKSLTFNTNSSATFARGSESPYSMDSCYYVKAFGEVQGTKAYPSRAEALLYNVPVAQKTYQGVDFFVEKQVVSNLTVTHITPFSATIGWQIHEEDVTCQVFYHATGSEVGTTITDVNAAGTVITGLQPNTTYEYQVYYRCDRYDYYKSGTFTTPVQNLAPFDISASDITPNSATISWTGYAESYNLRYRSYRGTAAKVTLNVPEKVWKNSNNVYGYQMLLDADHNTYDDKIPTNYGFLWSSSPETYAQFEYKIPANADGASNTTNIVDGINVKSVTFEIPAGAYDWCIVRPGDWGEKGPAIAEDYGNIEGRQNDFVFEAGRHYTFTVTYNESPVGDRVDMTVTNLEDSSENGVFGEWTEKDDITEATYAVSGLTPSTFYQVQVLAVLRSEQTAWSDFGFTTAPFELTDNGDNSTVIAKNDGQTFSVPLRGRTLYKDGTWNTLCLPFDVTLSGSPLDGAEARPLAEANISGTTLNLYFGEAVEKLKAGTPYIIKWATATTTLKPIVISGSKDDNGNDEDYANLVDGDTATKWYAATSDGRDRYCEFMLSSPIAVTGYTLTTCDDTETYRSRNPKGWELQAKANGSDEWVDIDIRDVEENKNDALPTTNTTESQVYAIAADKQGIYQYFRFTVDMLAESEMQLAELNLQGHIVSPVFEGVTINATDPQPFTSVDGKVSFCGSYTPVSIAAEDKSILYLGAENTLHYPSQAMTIGACRALFRLNDISSLYSVSTRNVVLHFGDEQTTGISGLSDDGAAKGNDDIYDLQGRRLDGEPTVRGVYIKNGKKFIVK